MVTDSTLVVESLRHALAQQDLLLAALRARVDSLLALPPDTLVIRDTTFVGLVDHPSKY